MDLKKLSKNNKLEIGGTVLLFLAGIIFITYRINYESLWADEGFSAALIKHSFIDILKFSRIEIHSQLYYWLLKLFTIITQSNSEITLRLFSVMGTVALAALGPTAIRRLFGMVSGLLFTALIFITPAFVQYSHEVRMYTWASFLTLAMSLYAFLAFKEKKRNDLILFGFYLAAAMYMHIIGLVGSFFFNFLFLLFVLIKKDIKFLKKYMIAAGVAVLLFVPRIFIIFEQAQAVNKNFWIPPVNMERIMYSLGQPFALRFWGHPGTSSAGYFVFFILIIGFALIFALDADHKEVFVIPISAYFLTLAFLIFYSVKFKPLLEPRYMMVITPWILLAFIVQVTHLNYKAGLGVFALYAIIVIPIDIASWSFHYNGPMYDIRNDLNTRLEDDDVFLHVDELTLGTFTYYFPNHKHYFLVKENSTVFWPLTIFDQFGGHGGDIEKLLEGHKSVYVVNRQNGFNTGKFTDEFEKLGKVKFSERYQTQNSWFKPFVAQWVKE